MICKRKIINWLLLIIWMSIISIMSHQSATISDSQSIGFINQMQNLGINLALVFGEFTNFIIRKFAHFFEYMILALLIHNVLTMYFDKKRLVSLTIIFVFIFASIDEFHQLFIVGRQGTIRDVIIDTCGGITFILVSKLLKYIIYIINLKVNNSTSCK